jgi:hypothetical protein
MTDEARMADDGCTNEPEKERHQELKRLITEAARSQVALEDAREWAQETWLAAVRFGMKHCPDVHTERCIRDECGEVCQRNLRFGSEMRDGSNLWETE